MLLQLRITNLATIEALEVDFSSGFSIVTGETGAGKSIMIDAIQLILGGKADFGLIRHGAAQAQVEAVFDIQNQPQLQAQLAQAEIPVEDELIVRRVLTHKSRQKRLINNTSVTQTLLSQIGPQLLHIHGQHDNQSLLDPSRHLAFLDAFAGLSSLRHTVRESHQQWQKATRERKEWASRLNARTERQLLLEAQCTELETLNPQADEDRELEAEAQLLSHAEQLMGLYAQMQAALYEEEGSATEVLSVVRRSMLDAARLDPACGEMLETLEACLVQVEELHQGLARRADRIEDNPSRLAWVNDRLSDLQSLQRKYRVESAADLANLLRTLRQELDALEHLEEDAEALDQRIAALYQTLQAHAQELSQNRQQAALKLDAAIQRELRELGMEKAIFATEIQVNAAEITALGSDRVEFLLSVNPGQEPRPLARVASGGELSRVMLAIQTILTSDTVETLIFDEVDTGISGRVAEIVGLKLASLGKRQQTLCITHLPQIAAFSQQHYAVSKSVVDDKTFTAIQQLSAQEAIQELARLMGGTEITPQTLKLAREMRKRSQQKLSAEPN